MRATVIPEPELEFHLGRHVDIRHGITQLQPLDADGTRAIEVAIVGSSATREGVTDWIERAAAGVPAKRSALPNLFPPFPGFSAHSPFSADVAVSDRLSVELPPRAVAAALASADPAREAAELIAGELRDALTKGRPDAVIIALPDEILAVTDDREAPGEGASPRGDVDLDEERPTPRHSTDLRDYLKAVALPLGVPLQLIRPTTYGLKATRRPGGDHAPHRSLQDEATRAWNFFVALYYKASGTPWRLPRSEGDLSTCYVGVSFFRSPDASTLQTSVAQVFNERGQGVVVRGGPARLDKDDRVPHVDAEGAQALLSAALGAYRAEHRTLPARVVVHKSSTHDRGEVEGFERAAEAAQIEILDLLSLGASPIRLLRAGSYPVLRGTLLEVEPRESVLYTRGSVPFFETYPGMYVPRPVRIRADRSDTAGILLAEEVLALTKMNWNNTQFDGASPITLRAAREVGRVLRYVPADHPIQASYAFYM